MAKPLTSAQQNSVLIAAILASSMAFIDGTALNVALPAIQRSLYLSGSQLLWVVNAYTLMLAALTLLGGALGDIYGKRKVFMIGIGFFTLFSLACGFAQSGSALIIFRSLQGMAAALMVPGSLSLISASFPRGNRGRAIGTWSMVSAFTTILGPVLGGYLAGEGLWRAIFFINVPLGLISFLILFFKVKEPVRPKDLRLDWRGGLLSTLAFSGLTYGFIEASEKGFSGLAIWLSLALGLTAFIAFLGWESKAPQPLLPLKLFRSPTFAGANAMTLFVYGALGSVLFFLPLNLIQVQGYPEQLAGLAILPFGGTIAILARFSGKWTDKVGAKKPLVIGPLITAAGFFGLSLTGLTAGFPDFWRSFFPPLLLAGIGMGLTVVPLTTAVMNCVEEQSSGIASGVNNTVSRLAGVLVLAIVGAVVLLSFQKGLQNDLNTLSLTDAQQQYMAQQAERLADARPQPSWPATLQTEIRHSIKLNFIGIFDISAYVATALCVIGAIVSWLFISGNPTSVKLN